MTGFDTLKHIEAMQETALALEAEARANGRYSRDCTRVNDAITRGQKSGVALLWDAAGRMEIVDLNGGSKHVAVKETDGSGVTVEHDFPTWENPGPSEEHKNNPDANNIEGTLAYRHVNSEKFKEMAAHSHERENATNGHFEPQVHTGPTRSLAKGPTRPTGDAARRAKLTADAKRQYQEGIARTAKIAAAMKTRSREIHK